MRYGVVFGLASLLLVYSAIGQPWYFLAKVSCGYAALAFAIASGAYMARKPQWLGKQANGTRRLALVALTLPYSMLHQVGWYIFCLVTREPAFTAILPRLDLGRRLSPREVFHAGPTRWTHVLDLTAEFTAVAEWRQLPDYLSIPVLDGTAPTQTQLKQAVDWLRGAVAVGPVYVHCTVGHSRSATVVAAFLLDQGHADTVLVALNTLRALRPGVDLNHAQFTALRTFANSINSIAAK